MRLKAVRTLLGIVALLCSIGTSADPRPANVAEVLSSLGGPDRPGCVAGVYRDGMLVNSAASGAADIDKRIPLTTRTVFNIASVSKQFTAFAVLLLEQRGALSLDASVTKYVPELGAAARPVTLRHLLHHTGGLREYVSLLQLAGHPFTERTTREQAIEVLVRQRDVNSPAGAGYDYSNTGYFLLGLTVERVSGRRLREFLHEEIFTPLGMTNTTLVDRYPAGIPALARGYSPAGEGFEINESLWEQTGDSQLHTTIEDLARWEQNFLTAKLGGAELMRKMVEPGVLVSGRRIGYGAGLSLWQSRGLRMVSHAGDWAGYTAHYLRFPQQRYAVAALCNRSDVQPSKFTAAIAEHDLASHMRGESEPRGLVLLRERGGGVHPSAVPAGLYRNAETAAYVKLSFAGEKARLQSGSEISAVKEAAPGVFHVAEFGRMYAVFARGTEKQPAQIVLQDSPQPYVYEFVKEWTPDDLAAYVGSYSSTEAQARYDILLRDGAPVLHTGAATLALRPMAAGEFVGEGLLGEGEPFTLRFGKHAARDGFRLFVGGVRGVQFSATR
jgi:CubicO group peptidase (beta-lactamase class C family)